MNEKIPTAIPRLDDFLDGGIPFGASMLFSGEPAIESKPFLLQAFYNSLRNGCHGVYLTSGLSPGMVIREFKEYGFDIGKYRDRIIFVDSYSSLSGQESNAEFVVTNPGDMNEICSVLAEAIDSFKGKKVSVGVDSISSIIDYCGEKSFTSRLNDLGEVVRNHSKIGIFNLTEWAYQPHVIKKIHKAMDAVVALRGIEEKVIFGQYFKVIKTNWAKPEEKSVLFKVVKPGGVKAFVPKVLVTGPFDAGKTTFVHALSTKAVSVDRMGTTVALDHGHISHKGVAADIFGTPGQERFDPIMKQLGGSALGVFLVVDSTKPKTFSRASEMIHKTETFGLPYIVVANKHDLKGALGLEEIRQRMQLPQNITIIPAVATENTGVVESFEALLDKIM